MNILGMRLHSVNGTDVESIRDPLLNRTDVVVGFYPPSPPIHRNYSIEISKLLPLSEDTIKTHVDKLGIVFDPSESELIMDIIPNSNADYYSLSQFTDWYCHYNPTSKILLFKSNPSTVVKIERSSPGTDLGFSVNMECMIVTSVSSSTAAERAGMGSFIGNEILSVNDSPSQAISRVALASSDLEIRLQKPRVYFYSQRYYGGECHALPVTKRCSLQSDSIGFQVKSVHFPAWLVVMIDSLPSLNASIPEGVPTMSNTLITIMTRPEAKSTLRSKLTNRYKGEPPHIIEELLDVTHGDEATALDLVTEALSSPAAPTIADLQNRYLSQTGKERGFITGLSMADIKGPELGPLQQQRIECRSNFEQHCATNDLSSLPLLRWVDFIIDMNIGLTWAPKTLKIMASVVRIHQISGLVAPPVETIKSVKSTSDAKKALQESIAMVAAAHSLTLAKGKGGKRETLGTDFSSDLVLLSVLKNSKAHAAGLKRYVGWVINSINGTKPTDLKDAHRLMKAAPVTIEFTPSLDVSKMKQVELERDENSVDPHLGFKILPDLVIDSADKDIAINHRILIGMSIRSIDSGAISSLSQRGFPEGDKTTILLSPKSPPPYRSYVIECEGGAEEYGVMITDKKIVGIEQDSLADEKGYGQFIGWYAYPRAKTQKLTVTAMPLSFVTIERDSVDVSLGVNMDPPLVISHVKTGSAGYHAGLRPFVGYLITEVNSIPISDPSDLNSLSQSSTDLVLGLQPPLVYCFSKGFYKGIVRTVQASEAAIDPSSFEFGIKSAYFPPWLVFCIFNGITKENLSFDKSTPFVGDLTGCCLTVPSRLQVKRKILNCIRILHKDAPQEEVDKLFSHFHMREGILLDQLTYRYVNMKRGKPPEPLIHLVPEEKEIALKRQQQLQAERDKARLIAISDSEKKAREEIESEQSNLRSLLSTELRLGTKLVSEITQLEQQCLSEVDSLNIEQESDFDVIMQLELRERQLAERLTSTRVAEEAADQRMKAALRKKMQQRALKKEQQEQTVAFEGHESGYRNTIIDTFEEAFELIKAIEQKSRADVTQLLREREDMLHNREYEERRLAVQAKVREARQEAEYRPRVKRPARTSLSPKRSAVGLQYNKNRQHFPLGITVIKCRNLYRDKHSSANPFVDISISNIKKRTSTIYKTLNPVWNETHFFSTPLPATIKVTVFSSGPKGDSKLGHGVLLLQGSLQSLIGRQFEIKIRDEGTKDRHTGTMTIAINSGEEGGGGGGGSKAKVYPLGSIPEGGMWKFGKTPPTLTDRIAFYEIAHQISDIDPTTPNVLQLLRSTFGPEPRCPNWYILSSLVPSYSTVVGVLAVIVISALSDSKKHSLPDIIHTEGSERESVMDSEQSRFFAIIEDFLFKSNDLSTQLLKQRTISNANKSIDDLRRTHASNQKDLIEADQSRHKRSSMSVSVLGQKSSPSRVSSRHSHRALTDKSSQDLVGSRVSTSSPFGRNSVVINELKEEGNTLSPTRQQRRSTNLSLATTSNNGMSGSVHSVDGYQGGGIGSGGTLQAAAQLESSIGTFPTTPHRGSLMSDTLRSDVAKVVARIRERKVSQHNQVGDDVASSHDARRRRQEQQQRQQQQQQSLFTPDEIPESSISEHSAVHDLMRTVTDIDVRSKSDGRTKHTTQMGVRHNRHPIDDTYLTSQSPDGYKRKQQYVDTHSSRFDDGTEPHARSDPFTPSTDRFGKQRHTPSNHMSGHDMSGHLGGQWDHPQRAGDASKHAMQLQNQTSQSDSNIKRKQFVDTHASRFEPSPGFGDDTDPHSRNNPFAPPTPIDRFGKQRHTLGSNRLSGGDVGGYPDGQAADAAEYAMQRHNLLTSQSPDSIFRKKQQFIDPHSSRFDDGTEPHARSDPFTPSTDRFGKQRHTPSNHMSGDVDGHPDGQWNRLKQADDAVNYAMQQHEYLPQSPDPNFRRKQQFADTHTTRLVHYQDGTDPGCADGLGRQRQTSTSLRSTDAVTESESRRHLLNDATISHDLINLLSPGHNNGALLRKESLSQTTPKHGMNQLIDDDENITTPIPEDIQKPYTSNNMSASDQQNRPTGNYLDYEVSPIDGHRSGSSPNYATKKQKGIPCYNYVENELFSPLDDIGKEVNPSGLRSVYQTSQGPSSCDIAKSRRLLKLIKIEMMTSKNEGVKHALELLSVSMSLAGAGSFLDCILVITGQAASPLQLPKDVLLDVADSPPRVQISAQNRCICIVSLQPLVQSMKSIAAKFFNVSDDNGS
eukprot:TRINITY_DN733_c2_g1_i1.p1 TRINITY_DN733_c2_g1~~TRINITY_DN733_c2_g1_i1.p1  ORF type:complete len:2460 (+),score=437.87 TRINITY_DN733_c2_g1_i1:659-7381(+)